MQKLNKTTDYVNYLKPGKQTQPFLDDDYVMSQIILDIFNKQKHKIKTNEIESLFNWIKSNVKKTEDQEFRNNYIFNRSAKETWESKLSTGCTDYALLFATFARQIGLPTTILDTAEYNWTMKLKNNNDYSHHVGHTFCECFYDGEWILVDPTCKHIEKKYNPEKIVLSYDISGNNTFIPFYRGNDLGHIQNQQSHNSQMDELCKNK